MFCHFSKNFGLLSMILLCYQTAFGLGYTKLNLEEYVNNKVKFICDYDATKDYNDGIQYRIEIVQLSKEYFMNYKDVRTPIGHFEVKIYDGKTNKKLKEFEAEGRRRLLQFLTFDDTTDAIDFNLTFQGLPEGFGHMRLNGKSTAVNCVPEVLSQATQTDPMSCNLDTDSDCYADEESVN